MEAEDAPGRATRAGRRLTDALRGHPTVADVRGAGLLLAVELTPGRDAAAVTRACLDRGLVVNAVTPTAVRLAPSLLVTDDELDEAVAVLTAVLDAPA